jgi:drug/metabolite transporter (DMT)-like permease
MNKKLINAIIVASMLLPVVALGADTIPDRPDINISDMNSLYDKIGTFMWQLFAVIALVMFVIAGIMFMTAQGDAEKIKTARSFIIYGVVGIIVAVLAWTIITLAGSFLS